MKRRSFIEVSAGLGFLGQLEPNHMVVSAEEAHKSVMTDFPGVAGSPGVIDSKRVSGRNQNRSTVVCQKGVCASSQLLATQAGVDVLKNGGNAIDAAIAINAVLSVVEPAMCGPGGDLFAIAWIEKEKKLVGLNASGRSPYTWNLEESVKKGFSKALPVTGPLTWSVPGCVSGWQALQKKYGKQTLKDVLSPAMDYALHGYIVPELASYSFKNAASAFKDLPDACRVVMPGGKIPQFGQVYKNPDLAACFMILMKDGAEAFYKGEIAKRIVEYSKERGGCFSLRDFADHTVTWTDPVSTNYKGYDVWELPPNGQGLSALQMLNILENFGISTMQPNSAEYLHLFIEAKKLAFEDRAGYYADMDFYKVPIKDLLSKEYGKERAKLIDPKHARMEVKPGVFDGSKDTVYFCAADGEGNMISMIQSIYHEWGSREMPTGLGFCLQNRGRSFSLDPKHPNALQPHKRPFHTIIPAFLTKEGKPVCAFGVMGGDMQPQGHVQVLINRLDFGLSMQQAGEQPRVQHSGSSSPWGETMQDGGTVGLEAGIPLAVADELKALGHAVKEIGAGQYGGYQAIWREDEPLRYFAGSDPRKDGCAAGW